jgi:long-subunit acyl-CoA synthetase (AMP-forming)
MGRIPSARGIRSGTRCRRRSARRSGAAGRAVHVAGTDLRVVDAEMRDVPADGQTMGEVIMRGNNVMLGYYKNPKPPRRPFAADGSTRATWR